MIIATVTKIEGNVFVKKIDGTISKLAEGDTIDSGDIVFGADEKSAYTIAYADNSGVMTFAGATPQLFDPTMIPTGADGAEGAVEIASANPFAHSILTKEEIAALISGEVLKGDENVLEETSSGQEKVKESEATGDTFAARSGAITDVNSGLRNAKFVSSQAREDVQDVFKREDSARLETSAKNNEMPPPPPPPPPAPTPPPLPELPVTPPPLRGILSLSGDVTVPEGAEASYTLSVTEAPKTPLIITIQIGHITTENGDLIPRFITVTIPAGQKMVSFPIFNNPDEIYEGSENYQVSIVSTSGGEYNELLIGDDTVVTTINDGQTPPTLTINDQTINEQEGTMTFTVSLSGITEADVTFEYASANTTATAAEDYSTVSGTKTIPAGLTSITITVPIHDDYISDNGETFQIILSNPSSNAVIGDGVGVGTILDDTGTPNTPSDGVEPTHESVIIKLVALDSTGNPILDGSGNYTFANDVNEGNSGHYMVLAFAPNETTFAPTTVLANQTGTVNVTFANGSATGAATQTTQDGSQDYNNAPQVAVTLGTVISTATFDDYLSDNNQTFTIAMTNDSYLPATGGYENVTIDTAPVTTTIKDGVNDGIPNQPIDTVYVQLATNDTVAEQANGTLTHELKLVDKDGNAVNLASGETLTVALTYTGDTTEAGDFSTKQTSVIITGNGGSTYSFDNTIVEDFFLEGNESYTVAIASITNEGSYFENVEIDVAHNSATGTITDGANDQVPNQPVDTVYVQLITDDTTREGGTLSHTVKLVDSHGIAITVPAGETITVNITYVNGVGLNTSEYAASTPIQIVGGTSFTTVTNLTNADALIESTESYTATISTVTQANGTYENIAPYTIANGADANAISVIGSITDGVDALPDAATVVEGSNTITHATFGNLLANDEIGVAGTITAFTYKDETGTTQTGTLGTAVDTQYGTLTLNANGTWTYISDPKETHGTILDTIRYTLTDGSTSSEADFVITVTDTTPTAVADTNAVAEDTASVSGNVFGAIGASANDHADTIGADTTATPVSGVRATAGDTTTEAVGSVASAVAGTYGSVNIAAGGGYTYTLNTTDVRVQHLANGETLTDSFVYTITDSDGDTSTTTLVITINGTDDVPAIAPVDGNGAITGQATVYEAGLASGSTPSATTETTNGTITLSAKDGLTSVTIGGTIITQATLLTSGSTTPVTINTVEGTLVINGFTPTDVTHQDGSGTINYTYTLNAQQAHATGAGNNELTDTIALVVTDRDLDIANGTLTVTIVDDVPTAVIETELSGLVEGGSAATSDASDAAHANLLTNDIVSADTTIYINQITYLNESSVSTDAAITNGSSTTVNTINGSLTVYSDGRWSFTPDGSVANPLNADATDTFTYRIVDADGDTSSTTKTFKISDGANPDFAPLNQSVNETSLGTGATFTSVTVTNTLGIIPGTDAYTAKFSATQASLDALGLTSGGTALVYTITDGVITAKAGVAGVTVFTVTLTNVSASNAGYSFVLSNPIDHIQPTHDTQWDLPFNVYVQDSDGDNSATKSFTVAVLDSTPSATDVTKTINEDEATASSRVIRISQDALPTVAIDNNNDGIFTSVTTGNYIDVYDADHTDVIGKLYNLGNGTLRFDPNANYSDYNSDSLVRYQVTDADGDTATANITLSVTPVADVPTMQANQTITTYEDNSWGGSAHNGDKSNSVALGLTLPTRADQVDQNNATGGDAPERLGLLTFQFSNSINFGTATIVYDTDGNGSLDGTLQTIAQNQSFTVDITDVANYHPTGTSGTYHLTQAQYNSLAIIPAEDNAGNIVFTIKTESHEVQDSGALFSTDIKSSVQTQMVTVDVKAVTDPVTLTFDSDGTELDSNNKTYTFASISEGVNIIDLDAVLTATSGDIDGSENRWYTVSGVPVGTIVTVGSASGVVDATGSVTVKFPSNTDIDPVFTLKFPEQYSGTVNGTITLKATDTAQGSATTGIIDETDSVTFSITVTPVADTATLAVKQAVGSEDAGRTAGNTSSAGASSIDAPQNGINLDIKVTSDDKDGSETYTVVIGKIPDSGVIYYGDTTNGIVTINEFGVVTGTNVNISVSNIGTDSNGGSAWELTITNFGNTVPLKFIPPHNSDLNYTFEVRAKTVDGTNSGSETILNMNVDVIGVADIPINTTLNTTTVSSTTVNYATTEQTLDSTGNTIELRSVYATPATIASYDSDSSESLNIVVSGIDAGFGIEGATFMGGSGEIRQWSFSQAQLNAGTVKITTPVDFSGTMAFNVKYITTESEGNSKTSDLVPVTIYVAPHAEGTIATATTINEDVKTQVNFGFTVHDTNEALTQVQIKISDVSTPSNFTLYYGNTATTLDAAVGNGHVTSVGGYYVLDATAANNIYALGASDKHGAYAFEVKYTSQDTETNLSTIDTSTETTVSYSLNVSPITDNIDVTGAINAPGATVAGTNVTVTAATTVTVNLDIWAAESDNSDRDIDGSEKATRFTITGVSEGVSVQGGVYSGDVWNGSAYVNSGRWTLDIADQTLDADGVQQPIVFIVNGDASTLQTSTMIITAYNSDTATAEQNGTYTFTIIKDSSYTSTPTGGPAIIDTFTPAVTSTELFEEGTYTLDHLIDATLSGTGSFSLILSGLPAGTTVSGATLVGGNWEITGDVSNLSVILTSATVTLPADYNSFNNADSDKFTMNATMTTYDGVTQNNQNLTISKPIYPVTDPMSVAVTGATTTEDSTQAFTVTLTNPNDGVNTQLIGNTLYIKVTEAYADSSESATGTLKDGSGTAITTTVINPAGLAAGTYYTVDLSGYTVGTALNFQYTPGANRQGSVSIDAYTFNKEAHGWGGAYPAGGDTATLVSHGTSTITFTASVDGIGSATITGSANEDTFTGALNRVQVNAPITLTDPSETIQSAMLDGIPVGFIVYYGADDSSLVLAQNAGTSATHTGTFDLSGTAVGYNQWVIPVSSGALPAKIYIQAPANWSGSINAADLRLYVSEAGSTALNEKTSTVNVTINPVSDSVTLNTTKTFGNQYSSVALNLNANAVDLDGSERAVIILAGVSTLLSADAWFRIEGSAITADSDVSSSYNATTHEWTLSNVNALDLGNIKIYHPAYVGDVNVNVTMTDGAASAGTTATGTAFNMNLASTTTIDTTTLGTHNDKISGTTGADIISTGAGDDTINSGDGNDIINAGTGNDTIDAGIGNDVITLDINSADVINGGAGTDTLIFTNIGSINLSAVTSLTNIEKIDLTANGNQTLTGLTMQQIFNMSDTASSSRTFTIEGDSGDVLSTVTKGTWTESSQTVNGIYTDHVYTSSSNTLTLKVETIIDTSGL